MQKHVFTQALPMFEWFASQTRRRANAFNCGACCCLLVLLLLRFAAAGDGAVAGVVLLASSLLLLLLLSRAQNHIHRGRAATYIFLAEKRDRKRCEQRRDAK